MGRYTSTWLSVDDAQAYLDLARQLDAAVPTLIADGRIPDNAAMQEFLELFHRLVREIGKQASEAAAAGQSTFDVTVELTEQELRSYSDMSGSLGSLLQIMAMRGRLDINATDGAGRFAAALGAGTYTP